MRVSRIIIFFVLLIYIFLIINAVFLQYATKNLTLLTIDKHLNLIPFVKSINDVFVLFEKGIVGNMNLVNNLIGNVLLFIPMPFFIRYFFKIESLVRHLIIATIISIGIESIQYIFLLGVTDIDDVLLNTLGAFIGVKLYRKINCSL